VATRPATAGCRWCASWIKEQQLGLFADRTSCHGWRASQFRLLLSSFAHVLLERLRTLGLAGTELARAQAGTIRLKLLKIGAVVLRNTRRIQMLLSSSHPYQRIFGQAAQALIARNEGLLPEFNSLRH
jgi:hypothetical protein